MLFTKLLPQSMTLAENHKPHSPLVVEKCNFYKPDGLSTVAMAANVDIGRLCILRQIDDGYVFYQLVWYMLIAGLDELIRLTIFNSMPACTCQVWSLYGRCPSVRQSSVVWPGWTIWLFWDAATARYSSFLHLYTAIRFALYYIHVQFVRLLESSTLYQRDHCSHLTWWSIVRCSRLWRSAVCQLWWGSKADYWAHNQVSCPTTTHINCCIGNSTHIGGRHEQWGRTCDHWDWKVHYNHEARLCSWRCNLCIQRPLCVSECKALSKKICTFLAARICLLAIQEEQSAFTSLPTATWSRFANILTLLKTWMQL